MPIAIYKSGPSNGAVALKNALNATLLRSEGSRYTPRADKLLINWGSSNAEAVRLTNLTVDQAGSHNVLNQPTNVGRAANKLHCLTRLREQDVATVPWYTNLSDALAHAERGRIYARTKLTGSSGEGIRLILSEDDPQAGEASQIPYPVDFLHNVDESVYEGCRLFTIGIIGRRQEWRVHVVRGEVILTQLKLRRSGFEEREGYTSLVRNLESGWVYSVNYDEDDYAQSIPRVKELAIQAVAALDLDFGAVDIVERRGEPLVLEVNTAPGLEEGSSSLTAYADKFRQIAQGL